MCVFFPIDVGRSCQPAAESKQPGTLAVHCKKLFSSHSIIDLWLSSQDTSATDIVAIFSIMDELGTILLTQTNITNITTDNIGM